MNTCDTCIHWKEEPPMDGKGEWLGRCTGMKLTTWAAFCRPGLIFEVPKVGETGVRLDGVRLTYPEPETIYSGPKFGCVHHKPK
jgi:hypothetical protein